MQQRELEQQIENGKLDKVVAVRVEGGLVVDVIGHDFTGRLSTKRRKGAPRIFKSADSVLSQLKGVGVKEVTFKL